MAVEVEVLVATVAAEGLVAWAVVMAAAGSNEIIHSWLTLHWAGQTPSPCSALVMILLHFPGGQRSIQLGPGEDLFWK